ncbi:hypothetical protein BIV57_05270 [Mangrovactinospora gilvigrisea]|uniref:Hint domain-containing protein n=1 Tax=Mangrovactinospora gilvigrisea TaxID=1428644 RepID=A0A1J7CAK4_9ACTN|nr:colicin D domain-containing protein [Mangrovactinospora gilvigrisea]OIV38544.1 hypothetical protein BIV57_05270 [Mangrovactinospora gilvigrisea]
MSGTRVARTGRAGRRGIRQCIVALSSVALLATGLGNAPAVWAQQRHHTVAAPMAKNGTAVPFTAHLPKATDPTIAAAKRTAAQAAAKTVWPSSATATLTAADPAGSGTKELSGTPGHLPLTLAPATKTATTPSAARVHVADRAAAKAAGVSGTLVSVGRTDRQAADQKLKLTLDYSGFAHAYGGNYASRLTLATMPACALTTPQLARCRTRTPIKTANDLKRETLSATVPVAGDTTPAPLAATASASPLAATNATVLAATAAPTSGAGTYTATSLNPTASWQAGGSSGDFTWGYPLQTPPAAAGPSPDLSIDYDAQSVDGRLPSTNTQPSWIGEGFELPTSYIERSYRSCDDDGISGKNDECWAGDNADLVLNGKATPLIKDKTTGDWHPKDDDGERVTRSTGAINGDNDGEYWTVTTQDGTQYVFGKNRLPGWSTGDPETDSTWTVPVFGNDAGEPCHADTFAASSCQQAWRWNLDYVVDPHGNAMSYWYTPETNAYAKNGASTATDTYTRGGYLKRIDYGITASTVFGTAPDQVAFTTAERCLPVTGEDCSSLTSTTAKDWPDVPFDQICASGATCSNTSPTFFTRKRLTAVTTKVWDASLATPAYRTVDTWNLDQSFPDPGDGTSAGLWLKSITRTGTAADGTTSKMPPVTFAGIQLGNRVDTTHDDIAALVKWRVRTITSETGSVLTVNYSDTQCVAGTTMPSAPDADTMRCFPSYWQPPYTNDPQLDYFHKYLVTQVNESDPTGGAPTKETDYTYNGTPAWHYDSDNTTAPAKRKTWSQWRGYGSVTTTTGNDQSTRTKTTTTYFRGMDGDQQADGTTRSAKVTDSTGASVTDADPLAGLARESITYNGSAEVSGTITGQWVHTTADDGTRTASYVRPNSVQERTDLSGGTTRTSTTTTTYDADTGVPTAVDDEGDDAKTGDEQCTRTTYANNTTDWLMAAPVRVETVDVPCSATPSRPGDVVSDTRTLYDNQAYGTAPTKGDATSTQRVSDYTGTTPTYQTVSTTAYDSLGRPTSVTDADNHTTTTAYTPATGGPLTQSVVTNAKSQATTTYLDPARGTTTATVDANGKRTDLAYDGLGRLTSVWLPNRSKSVGQTANTTYTYTLSNTAASVVTTSTLKNDGATYNSTYAFYDALLRPRQTQTPAPGGGRVINETKYDSRGLAVEADADYSDATDPGTTLANITSAVPSQTLTTYDGAGRDTAEAFYAGGTYKWQTTKAYGGDRVTVTPPKGGVATTTLTDANDHTSEVRQYDNGTPSGSYTSIKYSYNAKDQMTKVVDTDGNTWTYGYDLMGRKTTATDPDAGASTFTYNDLDQLTSTTDARGKTLSYTYDELGRKTGEFDGTTQDADHQLAKWTFDSIAKGQPSASVRYVGGSGSTGKAYINQVATYDALYRPTTTRTTIPSVTGEEGLAGSYTYTSGYGLDGTLQSATDPAMGGLATEGLAYGYDNLGDPTTLKGATGYVQNTTYTKPGDLAQMTLGVSSDSTAKWLQISNTYEDGTDRLSRQLVTDDTGGGVVQDTTYAYDDSGNPTKVATHTGIDGSDDVQCYRYDGHDRLTTAWTATDACAGDPTTAKIGGPAPYWNSYSYDDLGNRTGQVQHATTSGTGDVTTSYAYPAAGADQPHTLTSSVTTNADGTSSQDSYAYDKAGDTTTRTINGKTQTLDWDDEGNLAKVTNADGSTESYLYDADGNRLLSRDDTGTTMYLGDTEIRLDKSTGKTSATRYYTFGGQTIAARTSSGKLQWQVTDGHDTAETGIDATTQAVTVRRLDPFGNPRGTQPDSTTWVGDKGFVGGIQDTTSTLTHLGARDYDPTTGRFISVDPVLELTDPQQINGYSYAADNPISGEDPNGMFLDCGSGCYSSAGNASAYTKGDGDFGPDTKKAKAYHKKTGGYWAYGRPLDNRGWPIIPKRSTRSHRSGSSRPQRVKQWGGTPVLGGTSCDGAGGPYGCAATRDAVESNNPGTLAREFVNGVGIAMAGSLFGVSCLASGIAPCLTAVGTGVGAAGTAANEAFGGDGAGAGEDGALARCATHSFLPETKVEMADGSEKAIKAVKAGDKVLATDPATGKTSARAVERLITTKDDESFATLTIKSAGKTAKLTATVTHPIWVDSAKAWLMAGNLKPGMRLHTASGAAAAVTAISVWHHAHQTNDLTVSVTHTYYVVAGSADVLVHNSGGFSCDVAFDAKQINKKFKHASDFGVTGNNNKIGRAAFESSMKGFLDDSGVSKLSINYRGDPVTIYLHPQTRLAVVTKLDGSFLSGWKLSESQLSNVVDDGYLY